MPHRRRRSGGVEGQHMVGRQATHAPPSCRRLGAALAARACAWRHGVNSKSGRTTAPHRTRRSQRRKLSSVVATGSTPRRCWGSPSPLKLTNLAALVWLPCAGGARHWNHCTPLKQPLRSRGWTAHAGVSVIPLCWECSYTAPADGGCRQLCALEHSARAGTSCAPVRVWDRPHR